MSLFINKKLEQEYNYWINKIPTLQFNASYTFIDPKEVLLAHFLICDYFIEHGENIGGIGPRDINLLISAVSRQFTSFFGKEKWTNELERCATLFFGLIKNHPFHDGNKRTALLSTLYFLSKINRVPKVKHKELEELTISVAENNLNHYIQFKKFQRDNDPEILFIAHFFRKKTRKVNKIKYLMTFHELNIKLKNYNYKLDYPEKNYIYVIKLEKKLFSKKIDEKKILKIGFPGWKKEVDKKTIHKILKKTGITYHNGFDSETFFHEKEPLQSLIPVYHGLLMRLRDK